MFAQLLIKEWREKAAIGVFGFLVLAAFVPAYFGLAGKPDVREWLTYGLVLIFFPFVALLLGSAGFETEHRNDTWSFLLSRPMPKPVMWVAKYLAVLVPLGALWLCFTVMWFALPEFADLAATTKAVFAHGLVTGFPWPSLLVSFFLLTVAFALSMISEKPFSSVFASLILGGGFLVSVYVAARTGFAGALIWRASDRSVSTFELATGLMTLAVAAAAILTFIRADFSQPRKKTGRLATWTTALLVPVLLATAAWAFLGPIPQPNYISFMASAAGEPLYRSGGGIFKYSVAKDKIQWLTKISSHAFFEGLGSGTKLLYSTYRPLTRGSVRQDFWILDVATLKRHRIEGAGREWQKLTSGTAFSEGIVSPDGGTIVLATLRTAQRAGTAPLSPLWSINSDGSELEPLPVDSRFAQAHEAGAWLRFLAFSADGKRLFIEQIKGGKGGFIRAWEYDLQKREARVLLNNFGWMPMSPGGELIAFRRRVQPGDKLALSLLDTRSQAISDVCTLDAGNFLPVAAWNAKGDLIAVIKTPSPGAENIPFTLTIYSLSDGRLVAEKTLPGFAESRALLSSPQWLADDSGLVLNYGSEGLRIFSKDLREQKTIVYPPAVSNPIQLCSAGHCVLVQDLGMDALWRYDLNKGSWKRIY